LRQEVLDALHEHGPANARQLGRAVPALTRKITIGTGKYTQEASAHTRLLQNLGFDGTIVRTTPRGGWTSSEYTWMTSDEWIPGGINGADAAAGAATVLDAYVRSFGPVTIDDMRWWSGWTATLVKQALSTIGATEVTLEDGRAAWVAADDLDPVVVDDEPWIGLLPSLDSTAMGWKERSWYLGEHTKFPCALFDRNGNVGPTVWLAGRVVGAWTQRADGRVVTGLLESLSTSDQRGIDRAGDELAERIADTRVTPRFPTPLQTSMLS
jgi:Winged helix DNA-binding domain